MNRYITYAFGEILLVVIGILIAIQINKLYENSKNAQKQKINAGLLVENLLKDSIYIEQWYENVKKDKEIMNHQEKRMNMPNTTVDTIVEIASKEYRPAVNTVNFSNEAAFNTMVSTGEINLFDRSLIEEIYNIYSLQNTAENRSQYSFDHYLAFIQNYLADYFFQHNRGISKGPVYDQIWANINKQDFVTAFNGMFHSKLLVYQQCEATMARVEAEIQKLMPKLRKVITDN